jgi:hypothetical protein
MDLEDKVQISGVTTTLIYLYVVPAKVAGNWNLKLSPTLSKDPIRVDLKQQLTRVQGYARVGGKEVPLDEAKLRGERIEFRLVTGGKVMNFAGTIKAGAIEGTVESAGVKTAWSAVPAGK